MIQPTEIHLFGPFSHHMHVCVKTRRAHRKQDHRYSQSHSHQHSQPHAEDQDVQRIHPAVGVEQLGFRVVCADTETQRLSLLSIITLSRV